MKVFRQGMTETRLRQLTERFRTLRIAVLGDFFLDKYLDVDSRLAEVSIETGRTAHQVVAVRHSPGAAGTVVCNLAALGAGTLWAIGMTGDDGAGYELRTDLHAIRCNTDHLHCDPQRMTPTYLKPRDLRDPSLSGEHARYDTKNRVPTSPALAERILGSLDALVGELDAVAVLDQVEEADCGVVTQAVVEALAELAQRHPRVIFWADSRCRIRRFRRLVVKVNQFEAAGLQNPPPGAEVGLEDLARAAGEFRLQTGAPLLVTCGPRGILVTDPELCLIPGVRVEGPIDPTGAGDSTTAGCLLALAAGATMPEAALVGNLVASITIQQLATTGTARPEELPARLELWRRQQASA